MVVNSDKALSNTEFYSEECDRYLEEINRNSVAHSTCCPILLNVIKDGRKVCEFFDVPGQWCFDQRIPQFVFPAVILDFANTPNQKIWGFVIEAQSQLNEQERNAYVHAIHKMSKYIKKRDKVIFIINKIDRTPFQISYDRVDLKSLRGYLEIQYSELFESFIKAHPIFRFIKHNNYVLQPFMSGTFCNDVSLAGNTDVRYLSGPNVYPKQLWHNILKCIR